MRKNYFSIILLLLFSFSSGCTSRPSHMWNYSHETFSENTLIELDIHGVEVIYLPMLYNRGWKLGFHEFVSESPSDIGRLIILKRANGNLLKNERHQSGKVNMPSLTMYYKKSEDQKELYFRSTCNTRVWGDNVWHNNPSVYFMIQKPLNVRVEFYEDLLDTHFFSEDEYKREKRILTWDSHPMSQNGWSACKELPTTMTHLPGLESSRVFKSKISVTYETPYTWLEDKSRLVVENLNEQRIAHRRELFYQSVKEHNMRILEQQ